MKLIGPPFLINDPPPAIKAQIDELTLFANLLIRLLAPKLREDLFSIDVGSAQGARLCINCAPTVNNQPVHYPNLRHTLIAFLRRTCSLELNDDDPNFVLYLPFQDTLRKLRRDLSADEDKIRDAVLDYYKVFILPTYLYSELPTEAQWYSFETVDINEPTSFLNNILTFDPNEHHETPAMGLALAGIKAVLDVLQLPYTEHTKEGITQLVVKVAHANLRVPDIESLNTNDPNNTHRALSDQVQTAYHRASSLETLTAAEQVSRLDNLARWIASVMPQLTYLPQDKKSVMSIQDARLYQQLQIKLSTKRAKFPAFVQDQLEQLLVQNDIAFRIDAVDDNVFLVVKGNQCPAKLAPAAQERAYLISDLGKKPANSVSESSVSTSLSASATASSSTSAPAPAAQQAQTLARALLPLYPLLSASTDPDNLTYSAWFIQYTLHDETNLREFRKTLAQAIKTPPSFAKTGTFKDVPFSPFLIRDELTQAIQALAGTQPGSSVEDKTALLSLFFSRYPSIAQLFTTHLAALKQANSAYESHLASLATKPPSGSKPR